MQVCQDSASSSLRFLRRRILNIFENLHFMSPRQPIKLSELDKICITHGEVLIYPFCKKIEISPMTWQKLSSSTLSHYKAMGTTKLP